MVEKGEPGEGDIWKGQQEPDHEQLACTPTSFDSTLQVINGGVTKSVLAEDWKKDKPKDLRPDGSRLTCSR